MPPLRDPGQGQEDWRLANAHRSARRARFDRNRKWKIDAVMLARGDRLTLSNQTSEGNLCAGPNDEVEQRSPVERLCNYR